MTNSDKPITFTVTCDPDIAAAVDAEAVAHGLNRQQMLLKMACDWLGMEFEPRRPGRPLKAKESETTYRFWSGQEQAAVKKAAELGRTIKATIGQNTYRVHKSGVMVLVLE